MPRPWIVRNTTSWTIDVAKPQAIDETTKTISPNRKIGLRPYMSASFEKSGTVVVPARR